MSNRVQHSVHEPLSITRNRILSLLDSLAYPLALRPIPCHLCVLPLGVLRTLAGLAQAVEKQDLVAGVKRIFVITQHLTKRGEPKIIEKCTFPLTGKQVVERIYTNLAIIDVTKNGLYIREMAPGVDFKSLQEKTGAKLNLYSDSNL